MEHLHETDKKITKIFVVTDKKKQVKVMEGINEVVMLFSVAEEKEAVANNKLSNEEIDLIYDLLREGKGIHAISKYMGVSKKTVYNYRNLLDGEYLQWKYHSKLIACILCKSFLVDMYTYNFG